ncbi:MAG: diaminopimelate decarboxylase [Planctomycetota bacterium]|jgi:diaminopimelate decarboxylase
MDYFNYIKGDLFAESVDVQEIVKETSTPVYIYSKATFTEHLRKIRQAYSTLDTTICYSVKACSNVNILKFMAEAGSGFDIVSGGELYRVQQAGGDMAKVVYAGVGKTDREIIEALNAKIAYFNIESEAELKNLIKLAKETGNKTKAALRVNPDIALGTHVHITTGVRETKFGVDIERAEKVFADYGKNEHVELCVMHIHLGSGGKTIDPYCEAIKKVLPLIDKLRSQGHRIESLNLGGGYGADYESNTVPSAADYASGTVPLLKDKNLKLILEPGKSICANAGILVTRVLFTKKSDRKNFVIVDAGMNDLIRPALYDAFHFIWPVEVEDKFVPTQRNKELMPDGAITTDVVGPICEGADFFAKDRALPPVKRNDLIAIFAAGAYGFTMSSNYNARTRAAEVLADGDTFKVIRKRESYEDLTALEK